jgi:putative Holliday junction resolvase
MRVLGIDLGERRIGLAVSDATATLARPLTTLRIEPKADVPAVVDLVMAAIARLGEEIEEQAGRDGMDHWIGAIVVGMPRHLDGTASDQTRRAEAFIRALGARVRIPIVSEDERLSSREADSRLAFTERDWSKRKTRLDAAAAAVLLQDYLDRQRP